MTAKTEKALRKLNAAELTDEQARLNALLQTEPDNVEAKESLAFIAELLAAPSEEKSEKPDAAKELTRVNAREKEIKRRLNASGGLLTREQAESAVDHQEKFTALRKEQEGKAKKK